MTFHQRSSDLVECGEAATDVPSTDEAAIGLGSEAREKEVPAARASANDRWGCLMERGQDGDERAYNVLLEELEEWFCRYFLRRLPRDRVGDAVQDALLAVHAMRHTYVPSRPFGPWVAAIARYKWVDHVRQGSRFKLAELKHDIAVADHGSAIAASLVVHELLGKLKPSQADAIRMVKLEGETVEGASKRIGQSEALIKVNVHRGIRKLSAMVA